MNQTFLAIDLGAESGRGVLGHFDGERIRLEEIRRFATGRGNSDLCSDGVLRWSFNSIIQDIYDTLAAAKAYSPLAGIGVDSWGVDFGLLDKSGTLISSPVCYRDASHADERDAALKHISQEELWDATGIQTHSFNTLYQLLAMQKRDSGLLDRAGRMLLIPDLIHNRLTDGHFSRVERSNGSATQMMLPGATDWNFDLLNRLGLPTHMLPPIIEAGSRIGKTLDGPPVFAPATHDTASAVLAAPAKSGQDWAFLSSGTWSLLGAELNEPNLSYAAMQSGFSNECGLGGNVTFLKTIIGLWLVQQTRRSIQLMTRINYSYAELAFMADQVEPGPLIDATDERFLNPSDMIVEIQTACAETGQRIPTETAEIVRCCLESLALAYRRALRDMSVLLGREFQALHIVGGGSMHQQLNQWTADACGISVLAGPSEATALGNILGQMIGAGIIADWQEARELSRRSFVPVEFAPDPSANQRWAEREYNAVRHWESIGRT